MSRIWSSSQTATTARRGWCRSSSRASEDDETDAIAVRCSVEEANQLEPVEETAYIRLGESPELEPEWDLGVESVLAEPYYYYGTVGGLGYETGPSDYDPHVSVTYDRIPKGDVEIRRASEVTSADGHQLGKVDGFLVDDDDAITHFVLERGHLWGRREVTIPINAVDQRLHRRGHAHSHEGRGRRAAVRARPPLDRLAGV